MGSAQTVTLRLECRKTKNQFECVVEANAESLTLYWRKDQALDCPHCAGRHEYNLKNVYLANVLDTTRDVESLMAPSLERAVHAAA